MFDFVRKHTRIMQALLFLLIVPSFAIVGVNSYNRMAERGDAVARVDGREVMQSDWDREHRIEMERLRQQMPNLDAKMLDSPEVRYATLERIVRDRVLDAAANDEHLSVSDAKIERDLIDVFGGPQRKLDVERVKQILALQGLTPKMYEAQRRAELASQQVLAGLGSSGLTTPAVANASLGAYFEKREVQVARFTASDYLSKVNVTDADIDAFYKANAQMFQAPEQANVEYLVLDLDAAKKTIALNEQDVKAYYEQNQARYNTAEQRRASHILVAVPKNATPDQKAKLKAKAEDLLAQAKKNPDGFADLAKKNSEDPGSKANGGDLDWQTRGAMVKPFDDAMFSMKPGDINFVETEFGFHVIKLVDVKPGKVKEFAEVRPGIEDELKKQQAQKKFSEMADTFTNTVYEQADSLKPAADKLKLEIQTAANVSREPVPAAKGPLANPKFLAALFAPDAVQKKRNTEAVEVGPSQLASGRIVQYTPARTRPLAEVKDDVRKRLTAQKAAELAKKDGEEKLAAWKKDPASANIPVTAVVSRDDAQNQPRPIVEAALRVDPTALPGFAGVDLGPEGYAVVKVAKVVPRPAPAPEVAKQEQSQYTRAWVTAENMAYYELLKERYKAQILVPKPDSKIPMPTQ